MINFPEIMIKHSEQIKNSISLLMLFLLIERQQKVLQTLSKENKDLIR